MSLLTPNIVASVELSVLLLPIFKTKESSFVPRTINFQAKTLLRSVSRFLNTLYLFIRAISGVVIGKVTYFRQCDNKKKSFINILKSKSSKIEP